MPVFGQEIEASVQMRLYTLNKRQFVMVFVVFFICFGLSLIVGLFGPPVVSQTVQNATALQPKPSSLKTGPFTMKSPPMSTFNQQLWLIANIITDASSGGMFQQAFHVGVGIRALTDQETSESVVDYHNRTRELRCSSACDDIILLHLGYLKYSDYVITVDFYGLKDNLKHEVKEIQFFFKTYNKSFTNLEIWFRFFFLVLTFIATCLFAHNLRRFSVRDWSIEQRWMSALLPLLLLYNNPVFALTFLINSWLPGLFDAIFQATFLCALLLFWLCIYHGVRQNKRRFLPFYVPKLIIVGLIWISAITLSSWQEYNELLDPTYNYRLDTGNFLGFKVFFFVIGGLYLLYLAYLLVRAYAELRSMPYFDLRLKFMTALMIIVLIISIAITAVRFGGTALEDNFVAEISTHYQNSAEFLSFYGLLNFYLYTMAYVYSPSRNATFESQFRDNPVVSMLNDSDEEVMYGSDVEETSLTSRARPNGRSSRYDSEDEVFR